MFQVRLKELEMMASFIFDAPVTSGLQRLGDDISFYTKDGTFKWTTRISTDPYGVNDIAIGPSGTIYVSSDSWVVALDRTSGNLVCLNLTSQIPVMRPTH